MPYMGLPTGGRSKKIMAWLFGFNDCPSHISFGAETCKTFATQLNHWWYFTWHFWDAMDSKKALNQWRRIGCWLQKLVAIVQKWWLLVNHIEYDWNNVLISISTGVGRIFYINIRGSQKSQRQGAHSNSRTRDPWNLRPLRHTYANRTWGHPTEVVCLACFFKTKGWPEKLKTNKTICSTRHSQAKICGD